MSQDKTAQGQDKPDQNVIELAMCEHQHLGLRANQLYRFIVMPGCEACKAEHELTKLPGQD